MTVSRAKLEDPNVSIRDILTPEEESVWRLGGADYRLAERSRRIRQTGREQWQFGLVLEGKLVRVVGSVTVTIARERIWRVLSTSRKWPTLREKPPLTLDERRERMAAGRVLASAKRRTKAATDLARWKRKLKIAQGKVRKYNAQVKRLARTEVSA